MKTVLKRLLSFVLVAMMLVSVMPFQASATGAGTTYTVHVKIAGEWIGQGSCDSAVTFLGLLVGAAFCHNFGLAGAAASAESAGGPGVNGQVALIACIVVLFIIGFAPKKKAK